MNSKHPRVRVEFTTFEARMVAIALRSALEMDDYFPPSEERGLVRALDKLTAERWKHGGD